MIAPISPVVSEQPVATLQAYDPDFGRRWAAWVAKGVERAAQTRSRATVGLLAAALGLAAIAALRLFAA